MKHYAIFKFKYVDTGEIFEKIGANISSRGCNHGSIIASQYVDAYCEQKRIAGLDLDCDFTIYHNKTNANFISNQLRYWRGKISGTVSRNVASEFDLQKTDN